MKQFKEFFVKHSLLTIILITTIFGLGAGVAGEIAARAYLVDSLSGLTPFGNLDFSTGKYADQGLVITNPRNVIVQQDAKVAETIASAGGSLVGIYRKQKPVISNKIFEPDNFYKINESIGQGFVLTSDGWIATSLALAKTFNDYAVITQDKKVYQIDRASADTLTGFNFIHVQARDLSVKQFAEKQSVRGGQSAVAVNWLGSSRVSSVVGFSQTGSLVKSSDIFTEKLILNDKLPPEFKGSIIINLAGEVMGLVNDKEEIEPIGHLVGAAKSLFKNKANNRISLGVNYIDLADLAEAGGQNSLWQKGVIIFKDQKNPAVKKNSPADKAGLREGDIIVSVDGVYLNKNNDLADIVQGHLAGDTISLIILRAGDEKEVKVILGEIK